MVLDYLGILTHPHLAVYYHVNELSVGSVSRVPYTAYLK